MSVELKQSRDYYNTRYKQIKAFMKTINEPVVFPICFINEDDPIEQFIAMDIISYYFDNISNAAELTTKLAKNDNPILRKRAVDILRNRFEDVPDSENLLKSSLQEEDSDIKMSALSVLAFNFEKISGGIELLSSLAEDKDPKIRERVLNISSEHLLEFEDPIAWLTGFTTDPDEEIKHLAAGTIVASLGPLLGEKEVIGLYWGSGSEEIRSSYMARVRWWFDKVPNPQRYVLEGLKDPCPKVREWALWALGKEFFSFDNPFSYVLKALEDENPYVRSEARCLYNKVVLNHQIRENLRLTS